MCYIFAADSLGLSSFSDEAQVRCRHVPEGGDVEGEGKVPMAGDDTRQHGDRAVSAQSRQRCHTLLRP